MKTRLAIGVIALLTLVGWAFVVRPMLHDKLAMASEHAACGMLVDSQECAMDLAVHQAASETPAVISADYLVQLFGLASLTVGLLLSAARLVRRVEVPRSPPGFLTRTHASLHKLANHLLLQLRSGILNGKEYELA